MSFGRSARHGEGWQLSFVEAAELERAVRSLMGGSEEGKKAREKAVEMKAACRNAVEEGGSSDASLRRLAEQLYKGAVVSTCDHELC